jgi:hypothetical protein
MEHIIDQCRLDIVYFEKLIVGMRKFRKFVMEGRQREMPSEPCCGGEGLYDSKLKGQLKGSEFEKCLVELREAIWNVYNYKERKNIMKAKVSCFLGIPIPLKMVKGASFQHYMLNEFMCVVMCTMRGMWKGSDIREMQGSRSIANKKSCKRRKIKW